MVNLTQKQIFEKVQFLIHDAECGADTPSFLAKWHRENALALRELQEAYVRLNTLEQESLRKAGMSLAELMSAPLDKPKEPEILREKNYRRKV